MRSLSEKAVYRQSASIGALVLITKRLPTKQELFPRKPLRTVKPQRHLFDKPTSAAEFVALPSWESNWQAWGETIG
jgi:hypothetical protein